EEFVQLFGQTSFSLIVIVIGFLTFVIAGILQLGGFVNLLNIANEGHRLEFFNMNPLITERYNFYNTFGNGLFAFGAAYSITPTYAQRVCAVKTMDEAKRVMKINMVGFTLLYIVLYLASVVAYASYAGCDPVLEGKIDVYNQIFSFYIIDKLNYIWGLPGIYAATLASGTF
ncbi:Sodium-coupled monocarboxylate transporter 2, partial [Armadillidium nasatum]